MGLQVNIKFNVYLNPKSSVAFIPKTGGNICTCMTGLVAHFIQIHAKSPLSLSKSLPFSDNHGAVRFTDWWLVYAVYPTSYSVIASASGNSLCQYKSHFVLDWGSKVSSRNTFPTINTEEKWRGLKIAVKSCDLEGSQWKDTQNRQ